MTFGFKPDTKSCVWPPQLHPDLHPSWWCLALESASPSIVRSTRRILTTLHRRYIKVKILVRLDETRLWQNVDVWWAEDENVPPWISYRYENVTNIKESESILGGTGSFCGLIPGWLSFNSCVLPHCLFLGFLIHNNSTWVNSQQVWSATFKLS